MHTVTAFAESILFSADINIKLTPPASAWTDDGPQCYPLSSPPKSPTRSMDLALDRTGESKKTEFPTRSRLSDDRARGLVLHFFANHELLALELMALALLRWPDAPESFRRGIVQTMIEEQTHMRLYLERMTELGVSFGDAALNSFFWKCMRDLSSPIEYVAAMSMTFEQANIDFSAHYEHLFTQEGDFATAAIMRRVRLEEIGHVKHGVTWFERWRPKCDRLFLEWRDTLKFPMTPARAKGLGFDWKGRALAGLPDQYIAELQVHNQSKGRPPRVFWFNPGCEQEIAAAPQRWTPPRPIVDLTGDYAPLMALFAHKDDIVCVRERPTVEHLKLMDIMGLPVPEYLPLEDLDRIKERKIQSFEPWGWSPAVEKIFAPFESQRVPSQWQPPEIRIEQHESIFSKTLANTLREKIGRNHVKTMRLKSLENIPGVLAQLSPFSPSETVVFKSPFSASGRGMIRIRHQAPDAKDLQWIATILKHHGEVLAEPWLKKFTDLSTHVDIAPDGTVKYIGVTRFWTDVRGQYRGHLVGRMMDELGPTVIQSWHRDGGWSETLKDTAMKVGEEAFQRGYFGPLGIDALIFRDDDGLQLRPLLEINPRWSMGRMALVLQQRLAPKHAGIWIHISKQECNKSGHQSFTALVAALERSHPQDIRIHGSAKVIHQGVFPINDPILAKQSLALLIVGLSHRECYQILKIHHLGDRQLEELLYNDLDNR
jgi:uncharacterized ferritin-like protein (DUF455 family)